MSEGFLLCLGAIVATGVSAVLLYLIDRRVDRSGRGGGCRRRWPGHLALLAAVALYGSVPADRLWALEGRIFYVLPLCALTVGYGIRCAWRDDRRYMGVAFAAWVCFAIAWVLAVPAGWPETVRIVAPACLLSVSAGAVPIALRSPPT